MHLHIKLLKYYKKYSMIVRIRRRHNRRRCRVTSGTLIARRGLGCRMQHTTALRSIIKLPRGSRGIAGSRVVSQLVRALGRYTGIALKLPDIRRSGLRSGSRLIAIMVAPEFGWAASGIVIIVPPEFRGGRAILIVGLVTTTVTFVFATVSTATVFVVSALESAAATAVPVTIRVVPVSTKRSSAATEVTSSTAPSSA